MPMTAPKPSGSSSSSRSATSQHGSRFLIASAPP
jgi:hypothetical protein